MTLFEYLIVIGTIPVSFLILFLTWVLVTGFQRVKDKGELTPLTATIGYVVFFLGWLWDVWCNILCTLVFCDMIREFTVSERLRRLVFTHPGWRQKLAVWFAKTLVNPYGNGKLHIPLP